MDKKYREPEILENIEIIDAGSEGKAIAKVDEMVIFVPFVVPGDVVDLRIIKKKKSFAEAKAIKIHTYSDKRVKPLCTHSGICGGCKWQAMKYEEQLLYKQKQIVDNLQRIGKIDTSCISPIFPSANQYFYRNKLEYTFSSKRWLLEGEVTEEIDRDSINTNALGFHMPQLFDRVLDVNKCYLQKDPSNDIRDAVKAYALTNNLSFFDARKWEGFLRNLIIRTSTTGDVMVILIVKDDRPKVINRIMDYLSEKFPQITSLMYVVNNKRNDTIGDLNIQLYKGNPFIYEKMKAFKTGKELQFIIGPKSFYQTNSEQAYHLYKIAAEFADFKNDEIIYDLYTGTGTIANFVAGSVQKVVGIEYVPEAIEDAYRNSVHNAINNVYFYAGDMVKVLNDDFIKVNGSPDTIITDPPRAGMHEKVIQQILRAAPKKIVYISCNPATQARDIELMSEQYKVEKIQPVDMFPHTQHVENVVLLVRK
ncbi:MAG: 23S rRNA (uracil(1939)-C(5))-methyltransferase RlmD [Bacteroidota bacterium]